MEEVVALVSRLRVVGGKRLQAGAHAPLERRWIAVIQDHRHRVLPEVPALDGQLGQTRPQVADQRRGAIVHQDLARQRRRVGDVGRETDAGVVEVPALRVNLSAHGALPFALPLVDEQEIRGDFVEGLKQQRERLCRRLFQRQHAHVVVVEPQMRALTLKRRVADVVVEKGVLPQTDGVGLLGRVVDQAPEEGEGLAFREEPRANGVRQLQDEGVHPVPQLDTAALEVVVEPDDRACRREPLPRDRDRRRHGAARLRGPGVRLGAVLGQDDKIERDLVR